ncbi:hypothetical protein [Crocosphaera chwakensis]|uniref:Uncharacterized protein n=1 Tax=Crocosphaera chwakensis CCY0110 TaxID=391612 RepID=A3ITE9_9CHRO|nr:hypothetical protein [Crocosphaera chwakensis]EAZ90234.1 hypothetical protein CY0110_04463 [Crocosphaera chwakensis CCY0110]
MKINIDKDPAIIEEALQVLSQHLEQSKLMRFLAICNLGSVDDLNLKEKLFEGETVDSLYEKIKILEDENKIM